MLAIVNSVISEKHKESRLISIFTNYLTKEDGSKNLIKQLCLIYEFGNVLRTPLYSFNEYALTTYLDKIFEGDN